MRGINRRPIEPEKIERMFEMFRDFNQRTYSVDWRECWFNWVDREASIVNEQCDRQRRQAWRRSA
jgi:hypothetical protein